VATTFLLALVVSVVAWAVFASRRARDLRSAQRTISEQAGRLREAELIALVRAIETAGAAADVDEGLRTALDQVCAYGGFALGHVYRREGDQLVPAQVWCVGDGLEALSGATAEMRFTSGNGLPGMVLEAGATVWIERFGDDPELLRAAEARAAGVRTGFAFPVVADGEIHFVLEFFSRQALPADRRLIDLAEAIAAQLGHGIERRRADAELQRLAAIVEASSDAIIGTTVEGRIVSWNAAAEAVSGWSAPEVVGRAVATVIARDRRNDLTEILGRLRRGERVVGFETLLARKNGTTAEIALSVALVRDEAGRPTGISAVARDVTASKEAERRVLEAEQRYRALVEQLPFATYVDAPGGLGTSTYLSPQIEDMVGYAPEEWLADRELFQKLVHPDDRERVLAEIVRASRAGEPVLQEYRLVARDGRDVWVRDSAVVVRDEEGRALWRQGCVIDITEARAADERIRLAESRYRTLVEQLPLVVYIGALDEHNSAIYMSPQIEGMLGYPVQDWLDDREFFVKALHPGDRERVLAEIERAREANEPFRSEYRLVGKDGRVVWVQDETRLVRAEDGTPLYSQGFLLDITSRIDAERELERVLAAERAHNQKLRQLGRT
jgi:PAS domain S-box-containing protein